MISVLVCTYNHEKYIAQTIEGIMMQKCHIPFEVLVGDDCSTDHTRDVVSKYAEQYPEKIRLIYPETNIGASNNLVNLIKNAKGEIISICDGDDYWCVDNVLQLQWDALYKNKKIGMFCARAKCYCQEKGIFNGFIGSSVAESLHNMVLSYEDVAAPTICMRRELLVQCISESDWYIKQNYFYDSIIAYWFAYNSKIRYLDKVIAVYRVLEKSASHTNDYQIQNKYDRRYFSVKWHFLLTNNVFSSEEIYNLLMKEYDSACALREWYAVRRVTESYAYKIGKMIMKLISFFTK